MSQRLLTSCCIIGLLFLISIYTEFYSRSQRKFLEKNRVETAGTTYQVLSSWADSGVKGRVAVMFTRRLDGYAIGTGDGAELKYIEEALQMGIIRAAYHIVSDAVWPEVSEVLTSWRAGDSKAGFTLLYGPGRVRVLPLSRMPILDEKLLVVIAPSEWSEQENIVIGNFFNNRNIRSDFLTVLRGSDNDFSKYKIALNPQ